MSDPYVYRGDQEGPAIPIEWYDADGLLRAFATGWTFSAKLCLRTTPTTIALTKSTGVTGADTAPNVTIDWSTTDFSTLAKSALGTEYVVHLYARRTSDSKDFVFRPDDPIRIRLLTAPV